MAHATYLESQDAKKNGIKRFEREQNAQDVVYDCHEWQDDKKSEGGSRAKSKFLT